MRPHFVLSVLTLGLFSMSTAGCVLSIDSVVGSGVSKTESREVGSFDAVNVDTSLTANITLAPDAPQKVEVSGDDNLIPLIITTVSGGKLSLTIAPGESISAKLPLVVTISTKALRAVEASASASVNANAMAGDEIVISGDSSAKVNVAQVTAAKSITVDGLSAAYVSLAGIDASGPVKANVVNSGAVKLSGKAPSLDANVVIASSLDAAELTAADVIVSADTSSSADVCATASLNATVEDSSSVSYACNPGTVMQNVDPSSSLNKK